MTRNGIEIQSRTKKKLLIVNSANTALYVRIKVESISKAVMMRGDVEIAVRKKIKGDLSTRRRRKLKKSLARNFFMFHSCKRIYRSINEGKKEN